jgi:hypothetical protein
VTVDLGGSFYLRPPGAACANTYNCGYLQLFVDNQPNNTSATATINALIGNYGDPYGTFTFTVELVWDLNDGGGQDIFDAQVYFDGFAPDVTSAMGDAAVADPGPTGFYQQSVTIRTAASCSGGGTGGANTGGAPPSDGGGTGGTSPSDGGTGGAPPTDGGGTGGAPPSDGGTTGTGGGPSDAGESTG